MKLGVSYNVFDGIELLEHSIKAIRKHVDYITVVYQEVSNNGQEIWDKEYNIEIFKKLTKLKLVDLFLKYTPSSEISVHENESLKRNIGLDFSKKQNCTHYMTMDVDEFYNESELCKMKREIEIGNFDAGVCQMETYYHSPIYKLNPPEDYYVSTIFKINHNSHLKLGCKFPVFCDPTRRMEVNSIKIFKRDEIQMHHMSYIRDDIRIKLNTSSANGNFKEYIDDYVEYFNSWNDTKPAWLLGLNGGFKCNTIKTDNKFNIPDNKISICITLRNRASFLESFFHHLQYQKFNLKDIEICITDGYSDDNIMEVIEKWKDTFFQIKYAISDRSVLPFKIRTNNPACDNNAMICNIPTFEKIIRTDAEILFENPNTLRYISYMLNEPQTCIWFKTYKAPSSYKYPFTSDFGNYKNRSQFINHIAGFCNCFRKSDYIENGGIEEEYAKGFAGEDTYFLTWWDKNKVLIEAPYNVIHLYHGTNPMTNPEFIKIREEFTYPLLSRMTKNNIKPNINNPYWKRPEMIKNIQIFKGE